MSIATKTKKDINKMIKFYAFFNANIKNMEKSAASIKEHLVAHMNKNELNEISYNGITIKKVDVENISINKDLLKELCSARIFNLVTERTIDKDKFRACVKFGYIAPEKIDKIVTTDISYRLLIENKTPKLKKVSV